MENIIIIGSGGHATSCLEILKTKPWTVALPNGIKTCVPGTILESSTEGIV